MPPRLQQDTTSELLISRAMEEASQQQMYAQRPISIALTGFMGAGKSTVGALLARQIGWSFLDIDLELQTAHSRSAAELFLELGEAGFRHMESSITAQCLSYPQTVVALGGAAVDLPANQLELTQHYSGCLVFLDGNFDQLMERAVCGSRRRKAQPIDRYFTSANRRWPAFLRGAHGTWPTRT